MSHIEKEWMNLTDRGPAYRKGVEVFIQFARVNNYGLETCPCPCTKCKNRKRWSFDEVKRHLCTSRMDPSYRVWHFHGEKRSNNSVQSQNEEIAREKENIQDDGLGMRNFVDNFYGVHERLVGDVDSSHIDDGENSEEPFVPEPDLGKRYNQYKKSAEEKLYPGCEGSETTLSAIIELHNLKKQYRWSGASVTALLSVLKRWLPKGNSLPTKYPIMKAMLTDLGMKANRIHACKNNCILYRNEYENAIKCPQCETPRFKVKIGNKESKEPQKVLRHFPLIPRLKRLYTIPWIAHDMTWHDRATSSWDNMRHPSDSPEWRMFKEKWPKFSEEGRNVFLGIATDGFNPHGDQSASYSCWPVITVPFNLPPSLCMKSEFQMLSLLIPGPKAPGKDMDVFLRPLLDEMKELWEGVSAYDAYRNETFMLRSVIIWGIHDLPAYGNLSGCVVHGYKACPVCGDDTESIRLPMAKKIVYTNYRKFLRMDHPFRDGKYLGLSTTEYNPPPKRLNGQMLMEKLSRVKHVPGKILKHTGKKRKRVELTKGDNFVVNDDDGGEDIVTGKKRKRVELTEGDDFVVEDDHGGEDIVTGAYYKKSILFELEYFCDLRVRHQIDVMHTQKNVAEHILNLILDKRDKTKDTVNAREDMRTLGIHSNLWMQTDVTTGKQKKPKAPFILDKVENRHFFQILKDMKFPSGFASNLSNLVTLEPPRLGSMKSHDYHVIMQYLLPVLLQHAFPKYPDLRRALHQISLYFNLICSKVLVRKEVQQAKHMVAEALCVLEKYFPSSFFDISIHTMVHLADEALLCGPTRFRWMFPFERGMKDSKNLPMNKRFVEGSIAEAYIVSESVRYAMEYMPNPREGNHKYTHEAFLDEDSEYSDEGPLLDGTTVILRPEQFIQIRRWVLFRFDLKERDEYYNEYRSSLQPASHGKQRGAEKKEVEIQTDFIVWLYDKLLKAEATDSVLWRLVKGPMHQAKTYKKYRANGFVFSPKSYDDTVTTQDSGVCMNAITTCLSSSKDTRPIDASIKYYGVIKEILELDYTDFNHVLFYCDWVRVEDKTNGCKICPDSNLELVNFNKLKSSSKNLDEPVIFASEASQVFYSKDLKDPNWWVVIHSPKRMTCLVDQLEEPTDFQSILDDQPNLRTLLDGYR